MIDFKNDGHRLELVKLGILEDNETKISPEDFVTKAIQTRNVPQTITAIRLEFDTHRLHELYISDLGMDDDPELKKMKENSLKHQEMLFECACEIVAQDPSSKAETELDLDYMSKIRQDHSTSELSQK